MISMISQKALNNVKKDLKNEKESNIQKIHFIYLF